MKNICLTLLTCLALAAPASTQTITDPGFEVPAQGAGKFAYRPPFAPWMYAGSSGLSGNGSGFTAANPAAPEGKQVALLQGTALVSQVVPGWPQGSFQVSFRAAQRNYPATGSNQAVSVVVDGQIITTIQPSGIAYQLYYTPAFTVAAGDHSLAFQTTAVAGADNTAFLDAVQIIPAGSIPPEVTANAFVATSGKMIGLTFSSIDGKPVNPSQVLASPTVTVNGQPLGLCGARWVTGYHSVALLATPGNYQIRPGDVVRISAPIGWAFSAAGSVAALDGAPAENRAGKPMVADEKLPRTLRIGINNNQVPTSNGTGFYFPFRNLKYRVGWPPSNRGKINVPSVALSLAHNGMPNGVDNTNYPGVAGLWMVMWDASKPATPVSFAITTNTSTQCTIVERADLSRAPPDGVGMCRVFDVQPIAGRPGANFDVSLSCSDPAWKAGEANYSNLWVCQPGDWDLVGGQVSLDRSDPWALSRIYADRIGSGVGSMRWVDSTITGGNPQSFPYPEMLPSLADESWGDISFYWEIRGYSSAGPVDVAATPYIYSPFFKQPNQQFTATLGADVTTTPASGTRETWTIPDGDTAPLMAGLEITIDSEVCRIISGSGTSWTVNRGSNGTIPGPHQAGPVSVSGRRPITDVVNAQGGMAKALVVQLTTAVPHARTTGNTLVCSGVNWPLITYTDGSAWNLQGFGRQVYVTGPNTCFMAIQSAHAGGVPDRVYPLDPRTQTWDFRAAGGVPIEAAAIATGKFPKADFHVNVPIDAVDDLVWEIARRVRDNFPQGRRVYVEYSNEPWNWAFTGFYYHTAIMPLSLPSNPYQLAHYAYRAGQVQEVFRKVFATAGRAGEIHGLINCQMGAGSTQVTPALEYGLKLGTPFTDVAIAPYWSFEDTPYNKTLANLLDDEQLIDVVMADQRSNPRFNNAWTADTSAAIAKFNAANGADVKLYGYEGGIETAYPWDARRNHDLIYNPQWYQCELDWLAWCQSQGFDRINIYNHAMWWNPAGWGGYHSAQQRHSRGDGLNGAAMNQAWKRGVRPAGVNQDQHVDAVRPQAWLDWLGTLTP